MRECVSICQKRQKQNLPTDRIGMVILQSFCAGGTLATFWVIMRSVTRNLRVSNQSCFSSGKRELKADPSRWFLPNDWRGESKELLLLYNLLSKARSIMCESSAHPVTSHQATALEGSSENGCAHLSCFPWMPLQLKWGERTSMRSFSQLGTL